MPEIFFFCLAAVVASAVEVGGGPGKLDSNDLLGSVGMPLWAALAVGTSCRLGAFITACLVRCLVQGAPLGGLGRGCPLRGVGDPVERGGRMSCKCFVYVSLPVRPSGRLIVVVLLGVPGGAGSLLGSFVLLRVLFLPPWKSVCLLFRFRETGPCLL